MAERKAKFEEGEYYHVYNRGCGREKIFREKKNYNYLLSKPADAINKYRIAVIAYCLMPNHYHFLFRQDAATGIEELMQAVFTSYVKAFNKAYKRTGTLFEGPFEAKHVDKDHYLLHLCRYIHRNPIDAGLVKRIEDWEFSNYHEWIGKRNGVFVDASFVRGHFASPSDYQNFVLNYEPPKKAADELKRFLFD